MRHRLHVDKTHIANIFQIEEETKDYIAKEKYYRYKKATWNCKRDNSDIKNNTLNRSAKSISNHGNSGEKEDK